MISVDKKIPRIDNNKLRSFILHLSDVSLDENTKSNLQLLKDNVIVKRDSSQHTVLTNLNYIFIQSCRIKLRLY